MTPPWKFKNEVPSQASYCNQKIQLAPYTFSNNNLLHHLKHVDFEARNVEQMSKNWSKDVRLQYENV